MEFNKDKIQDLMNEWIIFRDETLCNLTKEDKEHLIDFDKYSENILLLSIQKCTIWAKYFCTKLYIFI